MFLHISDPVKESHFTSNCHLIWSCLLLFTYVGASTLHTDPLSRSENNMFLHTSDPSKNPTLHVTVI